MSSVVMNQKVNKCFGFIGFRNNKTGGRSGELASSFGTLAFAAPKLQRKEVCSVNGGAEIFPSQT